MASKPTVTVGNPTKKSDYDNLVDFVSMSELVDGDAGVTLTTAQFGKNVRVASGSAQVVTLPSISIVDIFGWFDIVSNGVGKVTLQCVDSDTIATHQVTSVATGKAENDLNDKFSIRVKVISATEWFIETNGSDGWVIT